MSDTLTIDVADYTLTAELFADAAPESVAAMRDFLPLESTLMHVRWSGIATWINIDEIALPEIPRENHTVYPSRGDVLLYPGYRNEQEILLACGPTCFKSPAGELAGNHVATIDAPAETLKELEDRTLEEGSFDVTLSIEE
jgi:hypothetical protein